MTLMFMIYTDIIRDYQYNPCPPRAIKISFLFRINNLKLRY
jgi:hypothetical protein